MAGGVDDGVPKFICQDCGFTSDRKVWELHFIEDVKKKASYHSRTCGNGRFKAVAGWFVCRCLCNIFEMINKSQKGLNFNPALHISPSTEKPILLGFSLLFTLAGLHFLLLPVTAIKISSRSAIMVSSCHCVDEQGEVQHCWNVLDSERDGRGGRIIPGPSCSLIAIL